MPGTCIWKLIAERQLFSDALQDPANKGLTLNKVMTRPKYATLLDGFDAYNKKLWRNFFNRWKDHISSSDKKGQSLTKKLHDARAEFHLLSQQKSQTDALEDELGKMATIVATVANNTRTTSATFNQRMKALEEQISDLVQDLKQQRQTE